MNLNSILFIDSYPKLDLHGITGDIARVMIDDFINDNIKMHNEIIVIIHGLGKGILKDVTLKCLKNNKKVLDFKLAYNNPGSTLVKLNLTSK